MHLSTLSTLSTFFNLPCIHTPYSVLCISPNCNSRASFFLSQASLSLPPDDRRREYGIRTRNQELPADYRLLRTDYGVTAFFFAFFLLFLLRFDFGLLILVLPPVNLVTTWDSCLCCSLPQRFQMHSVTPVSSNSLVFFFFFSLSMPVPALAPARCGTNTRARARIAKFGVKQCSGSPDSRPSVRPTSGNLPMHPFHPCPSHCYPTSSRCNLHGTWYSVPGQNSVVLATLMPFYFLRLNITATLSTDKVLLVQVGVVFLVVDTEYSILFAGENRLKTSSLRSTECMLPSSGTSTNHFYNW